ENRSLNMRSSIALPPVLGGRGRRVKEVSLPLSPCGRGWTRCEASRTGEGFSPQTQIPPAETDPSSGASRHLLPQGEKGSECYAASMRLKPFHMAVAAPEVRTG